MCECFTCVVNGSPSVALDDVIKPTSTRSLTDIEDHVVMETKLTIIEILKVFCFTMYFAVARSLLSYERNCFVLCICKRSSIWLT